MTPGRELFADELVLHVEVRSLAQLLECGSLALAHGEGGGDGRSPGGEGTPQERLEAGGEGEQVSGQILG